MTIQWLQGAVVGLVVLGAVAYLLRKYLPCGKGTTPSKKGCGNCSGCSGGGCH